MSARDLRAAVEALADTTIDGQLNGQTVPLPLIWASELRALLAEHPTPEPPSDHECDTGNFDRTICPEPCGRMHSYCDTCGERQDACAHEPPSGGEVTAEELDTAAYWQGRFLRMRAMYRERFNEGLSTEDWHRKHCGLMNAPEVTADELAGALPDDLDVHALTLAAAILARFDVRRRP